MGVINRFQSREKKIFQDITALIFYIYIALIYLFYNNSLVTIVGKFVKRKK